MRNGGLLFLGCPGCSMPSRKRLAGGRNPSPQGKARYFTQLLVRGVHRVQIEDRLAFHRLELIAHLPVALAHCLRTAAALAQCSCMRCSCSCIFAKCFLSAVLTVVFCWSLSALFQPRGRGLLAQLRVLRWRAPSARAFPDPALSFNWPCSSSSCFCMRISMRCPPGPPGPPIIA